MSSYVVSCSLCKDGDTSKQLVTEDQALEHLGEHSKFFLKKSSKYLKIACRVCGGPIPSSDEAAVNEHFEMFHPVDCFASREDFEDQGASIQEVSSKSRWDSEESDSETSEENRNGNEKASVGNDVIMNITDADKRKQNEVNAGIEPTTINRKELDQQNNNDADDVQLEPNINKPESIASESNETETSESSKEMDMARIQRLANHLGSVEQEIIPTDEKQKVNFNVTFGGISNLQSNQDRAGG